MALAIGANHEESLMFYRPQDGHPLPHNPFNAIVTPRPIGWISTRDADGNDNLAPYSFFNGVAYTPPQVMFASTGTKADVDGTKDSMANIRETGVFCVNIVEYAMRDAMNASSATLPHGADEFGHAGIEKASCDQINCARVATAPASLECRMTQMVKIEGENNFVVFGEVVGVHMRDDCIKDGRFDVTTYQPLSRLGYRDYARVTDVFEIIRPDD
ncbi:flavin reductase [Sulfitobacter pontiacus 3SOLIMAR09]|jgi:flavin reductase (DIM6/NTAB) family NADH-FMN oxidoreductase RutF|nr:flavin reductase [Sulfitobacter pontiacus 3SOLIMAR09]|tara:strand:- start:985 stop:1629 length:645 start_codon:yes stop_codon:yes gene_type:complete